MTNLSLSCIPLQSLVPSCHLEPWLLLHLPEKRGAGDCVQSLLSHPGTVSGHFPERGRPQIPLLGKTSSQGVLPAGLFFSIILYTVIIVWMLLNSSNESWGWAQLLVHLMLDKEEVDECAMNLQKTNAELEWLTYLVYFFPSAMRFILPENAAEALLLDARLVKTNSKYLLSTVLHCSGTEVVNECWTISTLNFIIKGYLYIKGDLPYHEDGRKVKLGKNVFWRKNKIFASTYFWITVV